MTTTTTTATQRTHYWVTYAIIAVAAASFSLLQSLAVPVLPRIQAELDTDQATATWVLTGYLLSAAVFTPIIGRLGDSYGKRRMFVVSLSFLCLGSVIAALAPSIGVLIAARLITGVGGGVLAISFGIIRDEFPEHRVAAAASVVSSLMAVGFGVGIVVAGPIVETLGYRWLFWMPSIVTGVAAVAAAVFIPESPVRSARRVPVVPGVLLAGWLVPFLLGMTLAPREGWGSRNVVLLIATAAVMLVTWALYESRARVPLIDMRLMRLRGVWTANLVALTIGFAMYGMFGLLPQFLQTPPSTGYGLGLTTTQVGWVILPSAVVSFLAGLVTAPMARLIGAKVVVVIGGLAGAIGTAGIALWHDSATQVLVMHLVAGLGFSLVFASLAPLILASVPAEQTGVANGMNANIRTIGGAIGTAVVTTVVTSSLDLSGRPVEAAYGVAFAVMAVLALAAAVAGAVIPAERPEATRHD